MLKNYLRLAKAYVLWRVAFAGAMTDSNRVTAILNSIMNAAASTSTMVYPTSWKLRLMTTNGSNTANGTEATTANCPGYTALGTVMAAWSAAANTAATVSGPSVAVSWTASGAWTAIAGIEIWDTAGTPLRWFNGALSGGAVTVNNLNTLQFAINSISLNGTAW